jgi:hypothetical protein
METVRIRDPIRDGNKSDPGSGINIPDPQHWEKGTGNFLENQNTNSAKNFKYRDRTMVADADLHGSALF